MNRKKMQRAGALLTGIVLALLLSTDFTNQGLLPLEEDVLFCGRMAARFHSIGFLHAALSVILCLLIYYAAIAVPKSELKNNIWVYISAIAFGILNAFGQQMYYVDTLPKSAFSFGIMMLYAMACAVVFYCIAVLFYAHLPMAYDSSDSRFRTVSNKKVFWISFCVILAGWLPWLITYYPASADWDVYYPISEYLGLMDKNNQQPWFYCCTVGFFYKMGTKYADKNVGMFVYITLRALLMSAVYSWLVVKLKRHGLRKSIIIFTVLFYSVVPVWGAYAKHAFKDTQGAALFCFYILLTIDCIYCLKEKKYDSRTFIIYSVATLFMSLYRNNCIYVAIPTTFLLLMAILFDKSKRNTWGKKVVACSLLMAGIIAFEGYEVYIEKVEHVASTPIVEALSIPVQQTARTVRDCREKITEEEHAAIAAVLDYDKLGEIYDPLLSDPVKWTFKQDRETFKIYLRTWYSMFFKYKRPYVEAALGQSYGYYAFTPDQAEHAGNWNCGMTYFHWTKDGRFAPELTCDYIENMEGKRKVLEDWANRWHELPILKLTDVKALYTWFIVLWGAYLLWRKQWLKLIPICSFLLMIASCCASPVNDCYRYFVPVVAAFPALWLLSSAADKPLVDLPEKEQEFIFRKK